MMRVFRSKAKSVDQKHSGLRLLTEAEIAAVSGGAADQTSDNRCLVRFVGGGGQIRLVGPGLHNPQCQTCE